MKYVCELCGLIYDEEMGDPKRKIPAGTAFADLPPHYECAGCGSEKEAFNPLKSTAKKLTPRENDREFWLNTKYSNDSGDSQR